MESKKQAKINHGDGDAGGVKRVVIGSATSEHRGMRLKMAAWSAGEQSNRHVSEVNVQMDHLMDDGLGNIK